MAVATPASLGAVFGPGSADPMWFTLQNQINPGDAVAVLNTAPPSWLNSKHSLIIVQPGTNCEGRMVRSISGQGVTSYSGSFQLTHPAGSQVLVCPKGAPRISPMLYGANGDNATNSWRSLQRLFCELGPYDIGDMSDLLTIGRYLSHQPLFGAEAFRCSGFRIGFTSAFSSDCIQTNCPPAGTAGVGPTRNAGFTHVESIVSFSVTGAPTTAIHLGIGGNTAGDGRAITFFNIYGAGLPNDGLPPEIKSGRVYRLLSYNSGTGNGTLAENATPTTPITFTGNGAGQAAMNHVSNAHIHLRDWEMEIDVGDLDGAHLACNNQPSYIENFRADINVSGGSGTAFAAGSQLCDITNLTVEGESATQTAAWLTGAMMNIDFLSSNGSAIAVKMTGRTHWIGTLLAEQCIRGIQASSVKGCGFDLMYYSPPGGGKAVEILDGSGFDVGTIYSAGTTRLFENPVAAIDRWDGSVWTGVGDTDNDGVFSGMQVHAGSGYAGLDGRYFPKVSAGGVNDAAIIKLRRIHKGVGVNAAVVTQVWLGNPQGFPGIDWLIGIASGAGTVEIREYLGTTVITSFSGVGASRLVWHDGTNYYFK